MHKNDILALAARIAGISTFLTASIDPALVNSILGKYSAPTLQAIGLLGAIAADVIRIYSVPTPTVPAGTPAGATVPVVTEASHVADTDTHTGSVN